MGGLLLVLQASFRCRNLGCHRMLERVLQFRMEKEPGREKHERNDMALVTAGKRPLRYVTDMIIQRKPPTRALRCKLGDSLRTLARNNSGDGVCTSGVRLWIRSCDFGASGSADIGNLGIAVMKGRTMQGMWPSSDQQTPLAYLSGSVCLHGPWDTFCIRIQYSGLDSIMAGYGHEISNGAWRSFLPLGIVI